MRHLGHVVEAKVRKTTAGHFKLRGDVRGGDETVVSCKAQQDTRTLQQEMQVVRADPCADPAGRARTQVHGNAKHESVPALAAIQKAEAATPRLETRARAVA